MDWIISVPVLSPVKMSVSNDREKGTIKLSVGGPFVSGVDRQLRGLELVPQ